MVHGGGDCGGYLWLVMHSGGDCGGDVVIVVGGA